MRVAVLGATGNTGLELLKEALARNYEVVALVRNPAGISFQHQHLKIEKCDIFNPNELKEALVDCDAVISCLGCSPGFPGWTPTTFYTDSMESIVEAMKQTDCKRLVCMSSWCTRRGSRTVRTVEWIMRPLFIGNLLKNLAEMEDFLEKECGNVDFTVVRPPGLTNFNSCGENLKVEEGQFVSDGFLLIPRQDVAIFMLNCLEKKEWIKKCVAIAV